MIVYFYPRDNTPGCTKEACGFRDAWSKFKRKKAVVLGVSPDTVKKHDRFKAKHDLNFTLISDEEGALCESYGVWVEKNMYGNKYMGVIRSHWIIGADGVVEDEQIKISPKKSIEKALKALD